MKQAGTALVLVTAIGALSLIAGCKCGEVSQQPFTPPEISLKEHGELKVLVDESLTFLDPQGVTWTAPQGTLTDGASVPRLALPITDGRFAREFLKAAVVHDAYCQKENENRTPAQFHRKPWRAVHRMFYEASIAGGTPLLKAKIMFAAVWLAGPRWDDPEGERQQASGDALTLGFTGTRTWITEKDPTIEEIQGDMETREPILRDLSDQEAAISAALRDRDTTRAEALLRDEQAYLEREFDRRPGDTMLLNFKGNLHKNRAVLHRTKGAENEARAELGVSEQAFDSAIARDPNDPSALNGLGSVAALLGDVDRSEQLVRKALTVAPEHGAAKLNLERIRRLRVPLPPQ